MKHSALISGKSRVYFFLSISAVLFLFFIIPQGKDFFKKKTSPEVFSSEGIRLRSFRDSAGGYSSWTPISEIPEFLQDIVILSEDKRFFFHPGFDPLAMVRSIFQIFENFRIISGASTITQQLARIVYKDYLIKNNYIKKIQEILLAVRLEFHYTKKEILEAYINLVPMPLNLNGFPAASGIILGKSISILSKEEVVFLAVLARGFQNQDKIQIRQKLLWEKLEQEKSWKPPVGKREVFSFNPENYTAHFTDWVSTFLPHHSGKFNSTLSAEWNRKISKIIKMELNYIKKYSGEEASVVVLRIPPDRPGVLELKSMVGSSDYSNTEDGQVNGAIRRRSAGSILKPFLYSIAFEEKIILPNDLLDDSEYGVRGLEADEVFLPRNNDFAYWGKITAREALVNSRNIPAYRLIDKLGIVTFHNFLKDADLYSEEDPATHGASLAMGTGGVKLLNLTRAYSVFISGGNLNPIRIGKIENGQDVYLGNYKKIFSNQTAERIKYILSDKELRRRAFGKSSYLDLPFASGAKTGTSKDSVDAWTIGFTDEFVVGVWVGNFNGKKMNEVNGAWGAGRIYQLVMGLVNAGRNSGLRISEKHRDVYICRITGKMADKICPGYKEIFFENEKNPENCSEKEHDKLANENLEIISPLEGEVYKITPGLSPADQLIPVIIRSGLKTKEYRFALDEENMRIAIGETKEFFNLTKGEHTLKIKEGKDNLKVVHFYVE